MICDKYRGKNTGPQSVNILWLQKEEAQICMPTQREYPLPFSSEYVTCCCFLSNYVGIKAHLTLTLQVVLLPYYDSHTEWACDTNIK
jgi:hypothetical protein